MCRLANWLCVFSCSASFLILHLISKARQLNETTMDSQPRSICIFLIMILAIIFEHIFKVQGHCPATIRHHILLARFQFKRLVDTDWLGCILACGNDPRCFSYNFCYIKNENLGFCELNGCWIQQNKLNGKDSLLVYAPNCFFQQLTKVTKDFPVCRRHEKLKPGWIQANTSPACLETDSNIQVNMPAGGDLTGMKLTYIKGFVTCNESDPNCAGKWGCSCCKRCTRGYTDKRLDIIVTDANRKRIFPHNRYPSSHGYWYSIPHQTNKDSNLLFPNLAKPLTVQRDEPLVIWYSDHLLGRGPALTNGNGSVCFDVHFFYKEVRLEDEERENSEFG